MIYKPGQGIISIMQNSLWNKLAWKLCIEKVWNFYISKGLKLHLLCPICNFDFYWKLEKKNIVQVWEWDFFFNLMQTEPWCLSIWFHCWYLFGKIFLRFISVVFSWVIKVITISTIFFVPFLSTFHILFPIFVLAT